MRRLGVNVDWDIYEKSQTTWDKVPIAVLMDIRDELQRLNRLLHCGNFFDIPATLRHIKRNTTKRKYTRKVKSQ